MLKQESFDVEDGRTKAIEGFKTTGGLAQAIPTARKGGYLALELGLIPFVKRVGAFVA